MKDFGELMEDLNSTMEDRGGSMEDFNMSHGESRSHTKKLGGLMEDLINNPLKGP